MDSTLRRKLVARYSGMPEVTAELPNKVAAAPVETSDSSSTKRAIPKDHPYDPKSLKPMAKSLWAASVSLGHALTAYRHLSRLKSGTISPDGLLGGRGYVMPVTDIRKRLYDACEALSAITDTLYDEITAPHWKPRLAQLDENEAEDIETFVEESKEILENPEDEAEEAEAEIEQRNDPEGSKLPKGTKVANSSIPVETLPGPRVVHLDRDDDPNPPEAYPSDAWGQFRDKPYLYPSPFSVQAESTVPDALLDETPTEAFDFGLGYGARGQGAGGYANPSGEGNGTKGVWGPHSGLPGAPAGSTGDTTDSLHSAQGKLPNDGEPPVARSDYYRGDRGNLVNTQSVMPTPPTPGGELDTGLMGVSYTYEDLETPYVRYDYTTHDYRKDPLHVWPQKAEQD